MNAKLSSRGPCGATQSTTSSRPPTYSMPNSSRTSRLAACKGGSFASAMPPGRSQSGLYRGSTSRMRPTSSRNRTSALTRFRDCVRLPSAKCSRHASGSRSYSGTSEFTRLLHRHQPLSLAQLLTQELQTPRHIGVALIACKLLFQRFELSQHERRTNRCCRGERLARHLTRLIGSALTEHDRREQQLRERSAPCPRILSRGMGG